MNDGNLGDIFVQWALREPSIRVLVMIGSRARGRAEIGSADESSDWDYQLITTQPGLFSDGRWARAAQLSKPLVYVNRTGRLGRVTKISAALREGELDLALLPFKQLLFARWLLEFRLLRVFPSAQRALAEMAMVLIPGYQILKGPRSWEAFFHRVVAEIPSQRLSNADVHSMAEGYVCDYISTRRKIMRGELLAAQRWLHCQLAETNFRLLHELKLRSNQTSFPDARRIEMLRQDHWRKAVTVNALPERESLLGAVEQSAQTCRELMDKLIGSAWNWPDLSVLLEE